MANDGASDKEARTVLVELEDNLHVRGIRDPLEKKGDLVKPDIAFDGEHYGWQVSEALNVPASDVKPNFTPIADVCTNEQANEEHLNTFALRPPEVIKLDCGYWGEYIKNGQRRDFREFGMIQGLYVWQCHFNAEKDQGKVDEFIPEGDSPVKKFFEALLKKNFSTEIRRYTIAPHTTATENIPQDELLIIFPDLHLPERWPDEPGPNVFHRNPEARQWLQEELIKCQHAPGWKMLRDMDTTRQQDIQKHLEKLIVEGASETWTIEKKGLLSGARVHRFTRDEFLAELAFVDRRIKAQSTWFYAEGVPQTDRMEGTELKDLKPSYLLPGDPAPAIDLVNLLTVVKELRGNGVKISVIQVGDLFEMWIGREFAYRYFPTRDDPLGGVAPAALYAATTKAAGVGDEFQLRRDAGWRNPADPDAKGFKHYVFDPVKRDELLERHRTGASFIEEPQNPKKEKQGLESLKSPEFFTEIGLRFGEIDGTCMAKPEEIGRGVIGRMQKLMQQRVNNIMNFCLPLSKSQSNSLRQLKTIAEGKFLESYRRPDALGNDEHAWSVPSRVLWEDGEFLFNKMIVDLLAEVGFVNIHGNHDGYRSDPLFISAAESVGAGAEATISLDGIWIEHGHRWEAYNRDGRAYGAGMTNLVYYQFKNMVNLDESKVKYWAVGAGEHTIHQPAAAQWFRIINFLETHQKAQFQMNSVNPFGIYVSGHTHAADLVRLQFLRPK